MSCEALCVAWNVTGVSAEGKLILLWLADRTTEFGCAVMIDPHGMGEFIGSDHHQAMRVLSELHELCLIRWGTEEEETSSYLWLVHPRGTYDPPINWMRESKGRPKRVAALIERDGPEYSYCGCTPFVYEVDHFVPKAKGGPDIMANLVLACSPCNRAKRDKMPEEFLSDRPDLFLTLSSNLKYLHA